MITDQLIREIWDAAEDQFFAREAGQIRNNVSERNLCGRLSQYLQHEAAERGLPQYYADPEYNRKQNGKVKTIINGELKVVPITCDLILHLRGERVENDNLIAIEMKKSDRPDQEKADDRDRLIALTKSSYDDIWSYDGVAHPAHVCGYRLGIYIELNRRTRNALIEYYRSGTCFSNAGRDF